jgi:hypothetical protein
MYSLTAEEPVKVIDSDRRCSLKIVTKGRDIRKILKYSVIESSKLPSLVIPQHKVIQRPPSNKPKENPAGMMYNSRIGNLN